jgi:O-antigen/teichoic acid export membrane protein
MSNFIESNNKIDVEKNSQNYIPEITIIAKESTIFFFGSFIGNGLKYLINIIIARYLGAALFGIYFLGLSVFRILERISYMGIQNGVLRYVAAYNGEKDNSRVKGIIIIGFFIASSIALLFSIMLFLLSKAIGEGIFNKPAAVDALRFFALALPFSTPTAILLFATRAFKKLKYEVYIRDLFEPLLRILFIIFIIIVGLKLSGIIFVFVISAFISLFLAFFYLRKFFPSITNKDIRPVFETKKLFSFSWPLSLYGVFLYLISWINILMLGHFLPSKAVGIYSAAHRTIILVQTAFLSFNSIFAPIISDLYNRKEYIKLSSLYKIVAKWIFSISLPISLLMITFAKNILILFGLEYTVGVHCFIVLVFAYLLDSAVGTPEGIIMMTGRSKLNLINSIILILSNVILNLFLIPNYGILGAALATGFSIFLINIIRIMEVYFLLKIHPYRNDFYKPIVAGGVAISLILLLNNYLFKIDNYLILLVISSLTFLGIYALILYILGIGEEEKIILFKIKNKVLRSMNRET